MTKTFNCASCSAPLEFEGTTIQKCRYCGSTVIAPPELFYSSGPSPFGDFSSLTGKALRIAEIDQLIIDLNRKLGVTSVVVTHEMDSAFRIADRMVLLDRGKFIVSGTPEQMRHNADPLVRQFVHGLTEGPLTDRRRAGGYEVDLLGSEH